MLGYEKVYHWFNTVCMVFSSVVFTFYYGRVFYWYGVWCIYGMAFIMIGGYIMESLAFITVGFVMGLYFSDVYDDYLKRKYSLQ